MRIVLVLTSLAAFLVMEAAAVKLRENDESMAQVDTGATPPPSGPVHQSSPAINIIDNQRNLNMPAQPAGMMPMGFDMMGGMQGGVHPVAMHPAMAPMAQMMMGAGFMQSQMPT